MATKEETDDKSTNFDGFLSEKNNFGLALEEAFISYFQQDNRPETEMIGIYMSTIKAALENAGKELKTQFDAVDDETREAVERHIGNTMISPMLRQTNMMMKRGGILGFLEKIVPILEIVKKVITHIIELFPNFLEKILKKIILPILELIENAIKQVLELFGAKSASSYLKLAEEEFLDTHPKWRKLYFESLDTTIEV